MTKTYNKLIARRWRLTQEDWDERRGSGRTTAILLQTLANCVREPGVWFLLLDHADAPQTESHRKQMIEPAMAMVNKLGLKFFETRTTAGAAIRCNSITTNPWEIA